MNSFLGPEGQLISSLTRLGRLIVVNILWIICCIPIVTVIPATTSFYYTVMKNIRRERGYVTQEFFHSMKRTFAKGILLSALFLLWGMALGYGRAFAIANNTEGFNVLLFAYDVLIAITACVFVCLIPVFSRFEMKLTGILKLSFVMAVRYIYFSAPLAVGAVLIGWLAIVKLPMFSIVILPGLWCYATTFIVEKMLQRYMPPAKEGEDAWYREQKRS